MSDSSLNRLRPLALAALLALGAPAMAQSAKEQEMSRRLDRLTQEVDALRAELQALRQAPPTPATAPATASSALPVSGASEEAATVLTSYGELAYTRPLHSPGEAQADLGRFVLGFQHRFDARSKVVAELEVEHAVSSADDVGEVAVEQAYVEVQLQPSWAMRAGLFLMPVGLLNENHEPSAFLGVQRNRVETAIIPTTWREGGVQFVGDLGEGLTAQLGLSTGFDLSKWDPTSTEGSESPLGSIHQEMAQAKAGSLAGFAALNWRGVPGLLLGSSLFAGRATHGQSPSAWVTLWDLHARWTPGPWDLSALATVGHISQTAALNQAWIGSATLIPRSFDGWYVQAGRLVWQSGPLRLTPFARYEQVNTARSYADLGTGFTPAAAETTRTWTVGANFQLNPNVVVKADLQRSRPDRSTDQFNLGLGWSF